MFEGRLLATEWYPLVGGEHLLELVGELGEGDAKSFARALGRAVLTENAGAVGRTLLRWLSSPERLARHAGAAFSRGYDSGSLRGVYLAEANTMSLTLAGWRGHGPLLCETVLGAFEAAAEHIRSPRLVDARRLTCVAQGHPVCRYQFTFTER